MYTKVTVVLMAWYRHALIAWFPMAMGCIPVSYHGCYGNTIAVTIVVATMTHFILT